VFLVVLKKNETEKRSKISFKMRKKEAKFRRHYPKKLLLLRHHHVKQQQH